MVNTNTVKNRNKIVEITSNSPDRANGGDASWKCNLSQMLRTNAAASNIFTSSSIGTQLDVKESVDLLMKDDNRPAFGSDNGKSKEPYKEFLKGQLVSGIKSTEYGKIASTIGNIAAAGITVVDSIANTATGKSDNATADVFNPWFLRLPSWDSSQAIKPVSFQYSFDFALGQYGLWNAKQEVVLPILNLMAPAIPRNASAYTVQGPYPSDIQVFTDLLTDAAIGVADLITGGGDSNETEAETATNNGANIFQRIAGALQEFIMDRYPNFTFDVKFGNFRTFRQCLIKDAKATFSTETDQYGYPIKGSVDITFETLFPAALTASYSGTEGSTKDIRMIRFGVDNG